MTDSFNVIVLADRPARNPGDWCIIYEDKVGMLRCFPHESVEVSEGIECKTGAALREAATAKGIPDDVVLTKAEIAVEFARVKAEIVMKRASP